MTIFTYYCDLFQHGEQLEKDPNKHVYYMHCISADLAMGAGIAVPFNDKFKIREQLDSVFEQGIISPDDIKSPNCIRTGRVLNLITKQRYWMKPSYADMTQSLFESRHIIDRIMMAGRAVDPEFNIHIVLPTIGCGLDKLKWNRVQQIIMDTFMGYPVEFHVCIKE